VINRIIGLNGKSVCMLMLTATGPHLLIANTLLTKEKELQVSWLVNIIR